MITRILFFIIVSISFTLPSYAMPITGYVTTYCTIGCGGTWEVDFSTGITTLNEAAISNLENVGIVQVDDTLISLGSGYVETYNFDTTSRVVQVNVRSSKGDTGLDNIGNTVYGADANLSRTALDIFTFNATDFTSSDLLSFSGFSDVGALAIYDQDTLYVSAKSDQQDSGLYMIDLRDSTISLIGETDWFIKGMDFGSDGKLYTIELDPTSSIYEIDLNNALLNYQRDLIFTDAFANTQGFQFGWAVTGITISDSVTIPEPNTIIIMLLGIIILLRRMHSHTWEAMRIAQ